MKKLFTGYYAKHGRMPGAISISVQVPKWFAGMPHFAPLAPTWRLVEAYKMGELLPATYEKAYLDILVRRAMAPVTIVNALAEGAILLCYERPPEFCHRHVAARWLMENTGCLIEELPR